MKKFRFVNEAARREMLDLPASVRKTFGTDLQFIQAGIEPLSPMENLRDTVGLGAFELKQNGSPAFRVVYCAKFGSTVFVLSAFTKTTNGVDRKAMETARQRYRMMSDIIRKSE